MKKTCGCLSHQTRQFLQLSVAAVTSWNCWRFLNTPFPSRSGHTKQKEQIEAGGLTMKSGWASLCTQCYIWWVLLLHHQKWGYLPQKWGARDAALVRWMDVFIWWWGMDLGACKGLFSPLNICPALKLQSSCPPSTQQTLSWVSEQGETQTQVARLTQMPGEPE